MIDPFRAMQFAGEISHLTIAFRSALVDSRGEAGGSVDELARLIAEDPNVQAAWEEASDFPRRDYMTFVAEQAHRAGVTAEALGNWLPPATMHAVNLLELAADEIAAAADPTASLLPEDPTTARVGPTGIYAVSTVCDSTDPEPDKIGACAVLNAAADLLKPTPA